MDVDIAALLGAIVEQEGGSYEIRAEVFERVVNDETEKFLTIDYNVEKMVLVLGIADAEDVVVEGEDDE
jgi:hypothetical protein